MIAQNRKIFMKKIALLLIFTTSIKCTFSMPTKPWTVLIFIAGDNDLEIFIDGNVNHMARIGSNKNCNIVLCVARKEGKRRIKKLKYILVEKNHLKILSEESSPELTDSGEQETLRNFCTYGIEKFPADNYGLFFWNHGTGPIDPGRSLSNTVSDSISLAHYRSTHRLATLPLINLKSHPQDIHKAVCFDDSTGNYLNEKKIQLTLESLCSTILKEKKFAVIGFDACLMASVETASLLKNYAKYMVASQEIEPGAGWNYEKVFSIFTNKTPTPLEFGKHIVASYNKHYFFADDLTLSCVNLESYANAEKELRLLIHFLQKAHQKIGGIFIKSLLRTSSHKKNCTHFEEAEYIDITHFLENLLYNFQSASQSNTEHNLATLQQEAEALIKSTLSAIEYAISANTSGKDFHKATGLSIYFPAHNVNKLYKKNIFCSATGWAQMLQSCLQHP